MSLPTAPTGNAGLFEKTLLTALLNECRGILASHAPPEEQLRDISDAITYAHRLAMIDRLANRGDRIIDSEEVSRLADQIFDPAQEYFVVEPGGKVLEEPWHVSPNGVVQRVPPKRTHED